MHKPSFLPHLHAFRGFAILSIVGAHAWSFMIFWTGSLDSTGLKGLFYTTETLFHGSTLFFAIISGLLFNKVLHVRGWKKFFSNKLSNVVLPYVVMTVVTTAAYWQYYIQTAEQDGNEANFLHSILNNLLMGQASIHFWYIPVLLVLFALTPVFQAIQRKIPWAIWILVLLPLIVSRSPFPDFIKIQSFVYFSGAYVLGMYLGTNYEQAMRWLTRRSRWIALVAALTSTVIFLQYASGYQPGELFSSRQTLFYIQKIALCLLVIHWFSHVEETLPKWLFVLGDYSFAIYFLHVNFIVLVIHLATPALEAGRSMGLIAGFGTLAYLAAISGSVLVTKLIKLIAGRHTRKLVGA